MKTRRLWLAFLSIVAFDQAFANSRSVDVLLDSPKATSIKNIEYRYPATGPRAVVPAELIREFLSDGVNLKVTHLGALTTKFPDIWNQVRTDYSEFLHVVSAEGVLVDDHYHVFRWRLICPNLLEVSDYGPNLITYLHLADPSHAVTIEGKSPKDYFLDIKRMKGQGEREQRQKGLDEEAEAKRTGIPRGLEPRERSSDSKGSPPR